MDHAAELRDRARSYADILDRGPRPGISIVTEVVEHEKLVLEECASAIDSLVAGREIGQRAASSLFNFTSDLRTALSLPDATPEELVAEVRGLVAFKEVYSEDDDYTDRGQILIDADYAYLKAKEGDDDN